MTTTGLAGLADLYPLKYFLFSIPQGELAFDCPKLGLYFCKLVSVSVINTDLRATTALFVITGDDDFFGVVLNSFSELLLSDFKGERSRFVLIYVWKKSGFILFEKTITFGIVSFSEVNGLVLVETPL